MAEVYGQAALNSAQTSLSAALEPARTFARLFVDRRDLSPPVNIREVLKDYADLEFTLIPNGIDAVVLRRKAQRPLVVVSTAAARTRERFTLAHELGHVLIPWQDGTVACHPSEGTALLNVDDQLVEREAHCFASEILLPVRWLMSQISDMPHDLAGAVVDLAKEANVSLQAAAIAVSAAAPFDLVMELEDLATHHAFPRMYSDSCRFPRRASAMSARDVQQLREMGAQVSERNTEHYRLVAVALHRPKSDPLAAAPKRTSKEILEEIIPPSKVLIRGDLRSVVSGIIGAANGMHSSSDCTELTQTLRMKFISRPDLRSIVEHPLFDEFLQVRAFELASRMAAKRTIR